MKSIVSVIAASALVLGVPQCQARDDGDLWILVVGLMCLAQNPTYADGSLGKLLLQDTNLDTFRQGPIAECFSRHNWASGPLCADIMSLEEKQMKDLQPVYERHHEEIRNMSVAFAYVKEVIVPRPPAFTEPSCPEAPK